MKKSDILLIATVLIPAVNLLVLLPIALTAADQQTLVLLSNVTAVSLVIQIYLLTQLHRLWRDEDEN